MTDTLNPMGRDLRAKVHQMLVAGPVHGVVMLAIGVSVVVFTAETMPEMSEYLSVLGAIDLALGILFGIEYVVRVLVAPDRRAYVTSFYGVVDLVAIAPSFVGVNSKGVRVVRLLRVLKALHNPRVDRAVKRLLQALRDIRAELGVFLLLTGLVVYLAATGIYFFEHEAQPELFRSIPGAFWWAVATLTTVGYGDVYPVTTGGKFFAMVVVIVGIGVVAIPTGLFASALTRIGPTSTATEERGEE